MHVFIVLRCLHRDDRCNMQQDPNLLFESYCYTRRLTSLQRESGLQAIAPPLYWVASSQITPASTSGHATPTKEFSSTLNNTHLPFLLDALAFVLSTMNGGNTWRQVTDPEGAQPSQQLLQHSPASFHCTLFGNAALSFHSCCNF